jgi:hypothetical protein
MHWLNDTRPAGYVAEEYVLLAANSILVIAIAARTVVAIYRHQLLPRAGMKITRNEVVAPLQKSRTPGQQDG